MGQKDHKIGEPITVVYQSPGRETGLTITAEIILPNGSKDSNFPDFTLPEVLGKGVYQDTFTPNAAGEWLAIVHKPGDEGQVVKRYSVGSHNTSGIGDAVDVVDGKVDTVDVKVDTVDGKVDNITTAISNIALIVDNLDTPPLIS